MTLLPFDWVDVFAAERFAGNQLAVFRAPADLPVTTMQQIARELNHSETSFLQPPTMPGAHGRIRIFIPTLPLADEVPFAGHPILGTACVAAPPEGGRITLETGLGLIEVDVTPAGEGRWTARMGQPVPRVVRTVTERDELAAALGAALRTDLPVEAVDNGMQTVIIPVASLEALQAASPDMARLRTLLGRDGFCTLAFALGGIGADTDVTCRVFSPFDLIAEDPATGSANGPLGEYLIRHGVLPGPTVHSEQGHAVGRPSQLHITVERKAGVTTAVHVTGQVVWIGQGGFRII